ncbi:MAG: CarD family transcriptional regulator [Candidatus Coproplasma sp.]
MNFSIGDKVSYGALGDCEIIGRERKNLTGTEREYLLLRQSENCSTIYLPIEKAESLKPAIKALSEDELKKILDAEPAQIDWSQDDRRREQTFKAIISSDDPAQACALLKAIYAEQERLKSTKRKLRSTDLNALKICEKILCAHLSKTVKAEPEGIAMLVLGKEEPELKN